jgi:hypothetical protein
MNHRQSIGQWNLATTGSREDLQLNFQMQIIKQQQEGVIVQVAKTPHLVTERRPTLSRCPTGLHGPGDENARQDQGMVGDTTFTVTRPSAPS